eukprot:scaffold48_cov311-Pinguiococcus_pyrenoidosus.AAC.175
MSRLSYTLAFPPRRPMGTEREVQLDGYCGRSLPRTPRPALVRSFESSLRVFDTVPDSSGSGSKRRGSSSLSATLAGAGEKASAAPQCREGSCWHSRCAARCFSCRAARSSRAFPPTSRSPSGVWRPQGLVAPCSTSAACPAARRSRRCTR